MTEPLPPSYQYSPLSEPRNIRVLVLEPASRTTHPIKCSFREISLGRADDDAFRYEALSYTWGAPKGTRPILCMGQTILVTPNCESALVHLRQSFKPRNLWIDAICIDQQSVSEKNQQVPLMGDIYRCASTSILWLGPANNPKFSAALRHAARYGAAGQGVRRAFRTIRPSKSSGEHESQWEARILSVGESEKIVALCANEWFFRMWTIQEFLLSKSAVFMMGNTKCPALSLYTYYRFGKDLVRRTDLEHYRMRNSLLALSPISVEGDAFKGFMSVLVQLVGLNKATDPRDKVYGMIAFLKHKSPGLQLPDVDYTKTMSEVYESFTRGVIAATKSLWPLEILNDIPEQESNGLPSWVLDLRDADRLGPDWSSHFMHPGSSKSQYQNPMDDMETGKLRVRATKIGKVARTSARMPFWDNKSSKVSTKDMDQARLECLSEWTAFATELDTSGNHYQSPYFGHFKDSVSKVEDWMGQQSEAPGTDLHAQALQRFTTALSYLRFWHELDEDKKKAKRKQASKASLYSDDETRTHDRCKLFLMTTGHLGECPGDLQPGDSVYVIEGAKYAFVLRRQSQHRDEFRIVAKAEIWAVTKQDGWSPSEWKDGTEVREIVLV
ncbi:heterokaryon incompatibility protein-domain-containing protein [Dactylonectria estremocensis]|uniref:Heterokaryon incompatibility protein-domain-containing protein n=1 Tax=Dactylonectria estremocensis TaxID=1079267 RepID=A0A9P9E2Y3_9HYPO|nr:heterokaryon incompatibility protein-domain-containing protein [Dactylonectria estremocensis]